MESSTELVEAIRSLEAKVTALLAVTIDRHLREHPELAKPRPRSVDHLLKDAGLSAQHIGSLLGKTTRAVYLALEKDN
jgi:hypothetical protein